MPAELRVLHVISGLGQGGAETALERLLLCSRRDTPWVRHEVFSLGGLGEVGARLRAAGLSVQALGLSRRSPGPWRLAPLWRALRADPAHTVVQTWMYHADLLGGLLARAAGQRRVIWNVRQTGLTPRDIGPLTRAVVRGAAGVSGWLPAHIVSNAHSAVAVHAAHGYAEARFQVIPNGFDLDAFQPQPLAGRALRQAWGVADADFLVGLVARLDPQKDHANFLQAARLLRAEHPPARFVLVGRGVAEDEALDRQIAELGLQDRVLRLAQREDIAAVMSALDLFCLSSRAEGFPNVLGEAMACATPSVSTRCGDADCLLDDPACLAPIEDPAALAACMLRVARLAPADRRALGQAQRARIQAHFTLSANWARYLALYQSCVA